MGEITASEIKLALSRMTNQRAAGPDGLHAELLKYGAEYLSPLIANIINTAIETNRNVSKVIGVGTMAPLAKPGKPRGPVTGLRWIVLQKNIRKALHSRSEEDNTSSGATLGPNTGRIPARM